MVAILTFQAMIALKKFGSLNHKTLTIVTQVVHSTQALRHTVQDYFSFAI
jgi:hypothetical protein